MPFLAISRIFAVYLSDCPYYRPMPVKIFRLPHLQGNCLFGFSFSTEISNIEFHFIATLFSFSYLYCLCPSLLAHPLIAVCCASTYPIILTGKLSFLTFIILTFSQNLRTFYLYFLLPFFLPLISTTNIFL